MTYDPKEIVEQFHLIFLRLLDRDIDKRLYAIKGGCNLRFYFHSFRYSEDLDIDVQTISVATLQNKVHRLLTGKPIKLLLNSRGIAITHLSEPKQSETTQRWKILLSTDKSAFPINTKIEFSRRGIDTGVSFDPIDAAIIAAYNLPPFYANHYTGSVAVKQKIQALIGRSVTQSRDIFDLHLLFNQGVKMDMIPNNDKINIETAVNNALSITFSDFQSQVVSYLLPEYQAQYQNEEMWNKILHNVIDTIQKVPR